MFDNEDDDNEEVDEIEEEEDGLLLVTVGFGTRVQILAGCGALLRSMFADSDLEEDIETGDELTALGFNEVTACDAAESTPYGLFVWEGTVYREGDEDEPTYSTSGGWRRATAAEAIHAAEGLDPWPDGEDETFWL